VVTEYVDVNAPKWGVKVEFDGRERGVQSFAFHPQFAMPGTPGYGKFYTHTDTSNMEARADFVPKGDGHTHDTVLLEWTAKDPKAATYDGGPPRELFRVAHPFRNHNGGMIAFNPRIAPGSPEYGLLYISFADGGSGGDPYNQAQDLTSAFGKILRIDPLGKNSKNGKYGIPPSNPFVKSKPDALGEIYVYGVRNPQRFSWDPKTGNMIAIDIGQNIVEEIDVVTAGANLGWNKWEGGFPYNKDGTISLENRRGDPSVTYPFLEFDHTDPLFQRLVAITGVYAYRASTIPQLTNRLIFGDIVSGEILHVDADNLGQGGQGAIRRILLKDKAEARTLLQMIQDKNKAQGRMPATRADLRLGEGPQQQLFVLNKADGIIRQLVP
jgi:hypothetical protein